MSADALSTTQNAQTSHTQPMVFVHRSPVHQWASEGKKQRVEPYTGALTQECSVYYYWWAYLACHAGYREACQQPNKGQYAQLYLDFGELPAITWADWLSPERLAQPFFEWWNTRGAQLFAEPASQGVQELPRGSQVPVIASWTALAVPMQQTLTATQQQVSNLLKGRVGPKHVAEKPTMKFPSRARYQVPTEPRILALYQYIECFLIDAHYWRRDANGKRTRYRDNAEGFIGKLLFTRTKNYGQMRSGVALLGGDPSKQSNEMSRRLKCARELINGVGKGKFPVFSPIASVKAADKSVEQMAFAWASIQPAKWRRFGRRGSGQ